MRSDGMNQKWDGIERRKSLRAQAENMVARFYPDNSANKTAENLLHELLVHKLELELQNEELRLSHAAMEEMRNRYLDLYQFAQVAYLTTDHNGVIEEVNQSCIELFELDRSKLIKQGLSSLIAREDQDCWHFFLMNLLASPRGEKQECSLLLKREDGHSFHVNLECLCRETATLELKIQIALIEIRDIRITAQAQLV